MDAGYDVRFIRSYIVTRLQPYVENVIGIYHYVKNIIGIYHYRFKPEKSTVNQIFLIRNYKYL